MKPKREEEEVDDEQDYFRSQLSLNSSTHENGAPTNRAIRSSDRFWFGQDNEQDLR